jgi:hypothetical protein
METACLANKCKHELEYWLFLDPHLCTKIGPEGLSGVVDAASRTASY